MVNLLHISCVALGWDFLAAQESKTLPNYYESFRYLAFELDVLPLPVDPWNQIWCQWQNTLSFKTCEQIKFGQTIEAFWKMGVVGDRRLCDVWDSKV